MAGIEERGWPIEDEPIYGDASLYGREIERSAEEAEVDFDPALAAVRAPERKPARRPRTPNPLLSPNRPGDILFALVT